MLSGANLSKDYFTNRQDRYIVFKNHSPFADYLHEFVKLFGKLSYTIKGRSFALSNSGDSFDLEWKGSMESGKPDSEPVHDPRGYTDAAKQRINTFMSQWSTRPTSTLTPHLSTSETTSSTSLDTTIQPFLQMGQFDIKQETDIVIPALLQEIQGDPKLRLDWTSGYFSLRNSYKDGLLQASGPVHIVCASPQVNFPIPFCFLTSRKVTDVSAITTGERILSISWFLKVYTTSVHIFRISILESC